MEAGITHISAPTGSQWSQLCLIQPCLTLSQVHCALCGWATSYAAVASRLLKWQQWPTTSNHESNTSLERLCTSTSAGIAAYSACLPALPSVFHCINLTTSTCVFVHCCLLYMYRRTFLGDDGPGSKSLPEYAIIKQVPASIDVISFDIYNCDGGPTADPSGCWDDGVTPGDFCTAGTPCANRARINYEKWLYPALQPHTKVWIVPGLFGDPAAAKTPAVCCPRTCTASY